MATASLERMTAPPQRTVGSRAGLALLGLGLAARLGALAATRGYVPHHDDRAYFRHARALERLHRYPVFHVGHHVVPTAYRPPGFPVLLAAAQALLGGGTLDDRLAQCAVGVALVALVGIVAARLFDRRTALVAMTLAALSPVLVVFGSSLISEPLFATLELAAVAAALCARSAPHATRWAVLAGIAAGAAALTRSEGLLALPAVALIAWRPRAWAPPLALVLAGIAVVAPWTVRNAEVLHAFVPVSTETGNTLAGTYNDLSANDRVAPAAWRDPRLSGLYPAVRAAHRFSEPGLDRALERVAVDYVTDHPLYPLRVAVQNAGRLAGLAPASWSAWSLHTVSLSTRAGTLVRVALLLTVLLAVAGALGGRARHLPAGWWLTGLVLAASTLLVNAEQRFAVPLQPWLILLAALPISAALDRGRGRSHVVTWRPARWRPFRPRRQAVGRDRPTGRASRARRAP
jgi:4-amino-4-deoxy-L-arabinose transferase-like glycosyltransferase